MSDDYDERLASAVDGFLAHFWKGDAISVDEWAGRYPDLAQDLREVLPTLIEIDVAADTGVTPSRAKQNKAGAGAEDSSNPQRFGDCRVIRVLGKGGMGVVYEGVQEGLDRPVAIKVLLDGGHDPAMTQRFLREARLAASLDHPHIVPIHAVGTQDDQPYLVMKLIRGRSFADLLATRLRSVPPLQRQRRAVEIVLPVAKALAFAHGKGVLHRDIKPANILLDDDGTVWLADFGLAKSEGSTDLTKSGMVTGTLHYLAPERLEGKGDHRVDVYALGLTLLEMASGKSAFAGMNQSEVVRRIVIDGPPQPRVHDPDISANLARVISRATARDLNRRYATASEFVADLEALQAGRTISAGPVNRKPWYIGAAAAAGLLLTFVLWPDAQSTPEPLATQTPVPPVSAPTPMTATEDPQATAAEPETHHDINFGVDPLPAVELEPIATTTPITETTPVAEVSNDIPDAASAVVEPEVTSMPVATVRAPQPDTQPIAPPQPQPVPQPLPQPLPPPNQELPPRLPPPGMPPPGAGGMPAPGPGAGPGGAGPRPPPGGRPPRR
jgi:serine/threonine protein kinase